MSEINVDTIKDRAGALAMTIDTSGNITENNKEYFRVDLTTSQTGINEDSEATVDFGGSGTVIYDTKSNFDSFCNILLQIKCRGN